MDLSSLEGPPIRTSTPSSSWVEPLPHIQLDTSVLSPSHSDGEYETDWDRAVSGLPPRPASTHALASQHYRPISFMGTRDDRLGVGPASSTSSPSSSYISPRPRSSHAHPSTHSALQPTSPSPSTQRRHPTRLQSHSFSSPHQLVWLDSEKIWVVMAPAPAPAPDPVHAPTSNTSANTNTNTPGVGRPALPRLRTPASNDPHTAHLHHAQPTPYAHPPSLAHARSMDTFFANSELTSPNYDDQPPPYERHIYDRQLAVGAGVSRWTSVARRLHQGPY